MSRMIVPAFAALLLLAALGGCGGGGSGRASGGDVDRSGPASRPQSCDDGGSGGVVIKGVCL